MGNINSSFMFDGDKHTDMGMHWTRCIYVVLRCGMPYDKIDRYVRTDGCNKIDKVLNFV